MIEKGVNKEVVGSNGKEYHLIMKKFCMLTEREFYLQIHDRPHPTGTMKLCHYISE